jgi:RNA 3'-terminal phosphate cyclase (ATP)
VVSDRRSGSIEITGTAGVGRLPESIAERMRDRAVARLAERGLSCSISVESWESGSSGAAISLTARTESTRATFVGLGERGRRSERVADDAVDELLSHLDVDDAALDPHSADQLILPAAFATGRSIFTISAATEHLRTNLETLSAFVDRPMRIEEAEPGRRARVIIG